MKGHVLAMQLNKWNLGTESSQITIDDLELGSNVVRMTKMLTIVVVDDGGGDSGEGG